MAAVTVEELPEYRLSPLREAIELLNAESTRVWNACPGSLPEEMHRYSQAEQRKNKWKVQKYYAKLHVYSHKQGVKEGVELFNTLLNLQLQEKLSLREAAFGMMCNTSAFVQMAYDYDQSLSRDEVFQAVRNIWAMTAIQLFYDLPVICTKSMMAYSLLYPYTDNYLDSHTNTAEAKKEFNKNFRARLAGEKPHPNSVLEGKIYGLVSLIEQDWDRQEFPDVFNSLLAIHDAQSDSLRLFYRAQNSAPSDEDVMSLSIEKGGTSVLADGYLVMGRMTQDQAQFLYNCGFVMQLIDDLQDGIDDMKNGQYTPVSRHIIRSECLDEMSAKIFHMTHYTYAPQNKVGEPGYNELREAIRESTRRFFCVLLIEAAAKLKEYYSEKFLEELENICPVRLDNIKNANLEQRVYEYFSKPMKSRFF